MVIGKGISDIDMFRGNFSVKEKLVEKIQLTEAKVTKVGENFEIEFSRSNEIKANVKVSTDANGRLIINIKNCCEKFNRIFFRLAANKEDHVYGCGEQFSYFDLRGKPFPLWTSEQGVGRNKKTQITFEADCKENAGGDYYWTFFPQPTFVTTQKYYCHADSSCYMNFDFSNENYHELCFWQDSTNLTIECADTYIKLIEKLTSIYEREKDIYGLTWIQSDLNGDEIEDLILQEEHVNDDFQIMKPILAVFACTSDNIRCIDTDFDETTFYDFFSPAGKLISYQTFSGKWVWRGLH